MHIHAAEAFYVLDGEYTIFVDDREIVCPAGSFVYIPAGAVDGFRVGEHPVESSTSTRQRRWSAALTNSPPFARRTSTTRTCAIAERYGMEVLGLSGDVRLR